ncbi:MAG: thioesterase family protein [Parasphingopyxis sp.]|uniref:acyl-CoA thioesterase n=1 Tax=Parasphingopyxis sp. TaxID=1920299 RepID=UPI0032EDC707
MSRDNRVTPNPAVYPHRQFVPTRFSDLDTLGHVNNVALARIFEDARYRFLCDIGISQNDGRGGTTFLDDARLVTVAANYEYFAECFHPDDIEMLSGGSRLGRSSWEISQLALQHGRPVSRCTATLVATDEDGAVPIGDSFRATAEAAMLANQA